MRANGSGWDSFLRYIRTPLGALLGFGILFLLSLPIILYAKIDAWFKLVFALGFLIYVIGAPIFVIRRTPRGPSGLVATEGFYALQSLFRYLKVYGDSADPKTRQAVIEATRKVTGGLNALPPPAPTKVLESGDDQT